MRRTDIINFLIEKNGYTSYLEIGVRDGINFRDVKCALKMGVDPDTSQVRNDDRVLQMTSDEYFEQIDSDRKFDIIFIDGLHLEHQVDKDIVNSLKHLTERGAVVLHDCNPPTVYHAREDQNEVTPARGKWNGTVWRSFVKLRHARIPYERYVVDTDWGCGVIRPAAVTQSYIDGYTLDDCLTWETFDKDRVQLLGLISTNEFLTRQTS